MECARTKAKHQTPSTKLQRSSKFQAPNQGLIDVVAIQDGALMFGAWNFSGAWTLEFEAFRPSHPTETEAQRTSACSFFSGFGLGSESVIRLSEFP